MRVSWDTLTPGLLLNQQRLCFSLAWPWKTHFPLACRAASHVCFPVSWLKKFHPSRAEPITWQTWGFTGLAAPLRYPIFPSRRRSSFSASPFSLNFQPIF
ncbi:hypothetical protein VitviT2T_025834 [Vitis vinifera]|uniref:Uncharacterized protein n=1 Tax=Vitis vinifera TaxID=29760 RepID=A0ABY9DM01_VITVI|nr:hypothetical protein VitviT2T_025834 [Vitis vinifera]